jgi:hypothetical protein
MGLVGMANPITNPFSYGNHNVTQATVEQAMRVLEAFDIVLVAESKSSSDKNDHTQFLADVLDVPPANASLMKSTSNVKLHPATMNAYQTMFLLDSWSGVVHYPTTETVL